MKPRYLPMFAAGLLTIGILGASDSIAAVNINDSISGAKAINSRIAAINGDIQQRILIDGLAEKGAIAGSISSKYINRISIERSEIADISLIAISKITDDDIQADQIQAGIAAITR